MKRLLRGLPLRSVVFCVTEYVFVCPIDSRIQAIIRKKRGICIFAVLRTEASRIALPKSDGNAESHAVYANHYNRLASDTDTRPEADIHIPTGIYLCTILDFGMKFCENFLYAKNKRG